MTSRILVVLAFGCLAAPPAAVAAGAQPLPFSESWTDVARIAVDDDWSLVPGIVGHRGDDLAVVEGADPQTLLADGSATPVDVIANRTNPAAVFAGGVAEFELADPVVALRGSATADAPHLVFAVSTVGLGQIRVGYVLRDIDGTAANATQPFALQYRVGGQGEYANVAPAYVADATAGPGDASTTTAVDVALPPEAADAALLELRVLTANAAGADEWVGVDDVFVTGTPLPPPDTTAPTLAAEVPSPQRLARALRRGVRTTVTIDEPATVRLVLKIRSRLARRLGLPRVVGWGTDELDAETAEIAARFTRAARRRLTRGDRIRLTVVIAATDEAGNRTTAVRRVLLTR